MYTPKQAVIRYSSANVDFHMLIRILWLFGYSYQKKRRWRASSGKYAHTQRQEL